MTAPDADGWIAHTGDECPVPPETVVDVRFRAGGTAPRFYASSWEWASITHYRIDPPIQNCVAIGIPQIAMTPDTTDAHVRASLAVVRTFLSCQGVADPVAYIKERLEC